MKRRKTGNASGRKEKSEEAPTAPPEEDCEEGSWACTVCTFRNNAEAFKCDMCDTRKGTSTRKRKRHCCLPRSRATGQGKVLARLNQSVVQQQQTLQTLAVQQNAEAQKKHRENIDTRYSPTDSMASTSTRSQTEEAASTSRITDAMILKRPLVPFRDSLVVRSGAKKRPITVNGVTFTITEFKPRLSPRGRKKSSTAS